MPVNGCKLVHLYLSRCFHILSLIFFSFLSENLRKKLLFLFFLSEKKNPYIEPYNTSILLRHTIMNYTDNHAIAQPRRIVDLMCFVFSLACKSEGEPCTRSQDCCLFEANKGGCWVKEEGGEFTCNPVE